MSLYRNAEGYTDKTAGEAMSRIMKEYRQQQRRRYSEKNRRRIYVASPFAGDTEKNTEAAIGYCRRVIDEGYMPVASHILYAASGMLKDDDPAERDLGLMFGLALLRLCDEVWVFGDPSPGMKQEIEEAKRLHKPVKYKEA